MCSDHQTNPWTSSQYAGIVAGIKADIRCIPLHLGEPRNVTHRRQNSQRKAPPAGPPSSLTAGGYTSRSGRAARSSGGIATALAVRKTCLPSVCIRRCRSPTPARASRRRAASLEQGLHPAHLRRADIARNIRDNENTFEAVAREWLEKRPGKAAAWSLRYCAEAKRTLEKDAFPQLGGLPLKSIATHDLVRLLKRVADRGAESVAINMRGFR